MSRSSSSSVAPSAAVRTIRPASPGRKRSSTRRRRLRSSSGRRFEMPYVCGWPGTITTNRPARLTSCVSRAPLCPIGFFVTCTMIAWPLRSTRSMRGRSPPSTSDGSYATSPRYSTPFFGVPMSMNAASMPGSTFCTRPR